MRAFRADYHCIPRVRSNIALLSSRVSHARFVSVGLLGSAFCRPEGKIIGSIKSPAFVLFSRLRDGNGSPKQRSHESLEVEFGRRFLVFSSQAILRIGK